MKNAILLVVGIVFLASGVSAKLIRDGIDIDFVTIGNAGNPDDDISGYGAVGYVYSIGKYEITNGQWDTFVSAAGEPTGNAPGAYNESASFTGTNIPTNEVSWLEAAQFCNYLTSGDKSIGAYLFSGNNANPGDFLGIDRFSAVLTYDGIAYFIPTEDEWCKAAWYTGSEYSIYANGTDTAPTPEVDSNYGTGGIYSGPWDVGTGTMEQNGTFNMMGNVYEWNEGFNGSYRALRGGSYESDQARIRASWRLSYSGDDDNSIGFRVASVPEPCSLAILAIGGLALRKRKQ
jgi:formylglycine-generating enzyme